GRLARGRRPCAGRAHRAARARLGARRGQARGRGCVRRSARRVVGRPPQVLTPTRGGAPVSELRVTSRFVIAEGELSERFTRASGPGGQGVNTTSSRVELSFDVARSPSVPDSLRPRLLARLDRRLVDGVLTVVAR